MCTPGVFWEAPGEGFNSIANVPEYFPYGKSPAGNDPIAARALNTCMHERMPTQPARGSLYTKLYSAENFLSHSSPRRGTNLFATTPPSSANSPSTVQDIDNDEDMMVEDAATHLTVVAHRKRGRDYQQDLGFADGYLTKRQRVVQPQRQCGFPVGNQVPCNNKAFFQNTTGWF